MARSKHEMPFGGEIQPDGSVRFRLWAPAAKDVRLVLENSHQFLPMRAVDNGWFELTTTEARAGSRYQFQINGETKVPDSASRFQPQDVHGPSEVIAPDAFQWTDDQWRGRAWEEAVIYELHVGAFSPEGTYQGVQHRLDYLRDLGITAIELMPVADFPGRRNWGYDGVLPFAPDSSYGRPEDLKRLVQAAHEKGLMIFLDVVYNHFGPDGNYLHLYAPQFFTKRHHTPWGAAINFDGPERRVVRDFFIDNALYWLDEYHFDGLRLDAVHAIIDDSTPDILTELAHRVREQFGNDRHVHLVLENADNAAHYLRRDSRGAPQLYDAQWNDDIHHAVHVLLTGESDGYYSDYQKDPMRHLCRCLREGFAYQGDFSDYHSCNRGERSAHLPLSAFVSFLQNHDQIGNRAFGDRILQIAPAQAVKAVMEILLLAPSPPLLFMGEEFAADTPFLFFCDFHGDLAAAVTNGRRSEFARFAKFNSPEVRDSIPDPNAEETFLRSKLNWSSLSAPSHTLWFSFYRELLSIRQGAIVPHIGRISDSRCHAFEAPQRLLSIDWICDNKARLELRANLSNELSTSKLNYSGGLIYASSSDARSAIEQGSLPPWSVAWSFRN
ncbi:MAG TPA: malto-oligosyltrehalose trehalohydrolase [Candidatus Sulfotelmatobacter sp.]|nr:malto-oligosyltrehalose trehalohydrolase [Candidatus Sulfotelmatobacter sp.]